MIPLKLELRNFMAYREADPLDMSGLHVVCLTGDNGAGKSTLLDAMTWALWGQSRANRDDELIAQGASEMRVTFIFSEGRDVFQVVRARRLGKAVKGKATASSGALEFLIRDEASNSWRTISEGRVADTQAKIERVLSLSYETFINSAYLKQGRADEFTVKPPGQRKQLLAEILNLDVWGEYEERVKQRQTAVEKEIYKLSQDLQRADDELARLPAYERTLGEARAGRDAAIAEYERADQAFREVELLRERMKGLRGQLQQAEARVRGVDDDLRRVAGEREGVLERIRRWQVALDQREEIEAGFAALERARAEMDLLNAKLSSMVDLNDRKNRAEAAIAAERHRIESAVEVARTRLSALRAAADATDAQVKLVQVRGRLAQIAAASDRHEAAITLRLKLAEELSEIKSCNDGLHKEMKEIKARMDALDRVGAICPGCGRELTDADRTRQRDEWYARGKAKGDEHRANDVRLKKASEDRARLDAEIDALAAEKRGLSALERDESMLAEKCRVAAEAAAALAAAQVDFDAAAALATEQAYAPQARADLRQVEAELVELGYDSAVHDRLRKVTLPSLQLFDARRKEAERAEASLQAERLAESSLAAQLGLLQERRADEQRALEALRVQAAETETGLVNAGAVQSALIAAQAAQQEWQRRYGVASQQVQACRSMQEMAARMRVEAAALQRRGALLDELRAACGRNGVPAMIIESALPELEASANELLGRMTNGRMNVRFDTQRLSQKGEAIETLEIRIADEVGERAYELFSGGEAFRINFAVRIALSRMLARRAGAALRTLFIDEGFGTQDAQGRERLVEAIKAIESDFDRVFVITHIDELKDAFPARIEVTKSTRGSGARVI